MSRRIDTGAVEEGRSDASPAEKIGKPLYLGKKRGEDYLGRLAKYIPAEIVALYLATSGMVPPRPDHKPRYLALWIIFGLSWIFAPLYFIFATTESRKGPLWPQVLLASLAFPVWVFAIGGPFQYLSWYEGWIASVTLAFVTVAFGLYQPQRGS